MSPSAAAPAPPGAAPEELFEALRTLGPLRVISTSGPSVFEALCELPAWGIADGWMNAITPAYHWHLRLDGLGHVTTRDEIHARSGRRVLFFELRERPQDPPFLLVYLHRERDEELDAERQRLFAGLHARWVDGAAVGSPT